MKRGLYCLCTVLFGLTLNAGPHRKTDNLPLSASSATLDSSTTLLQEGWSAVAAARYLDARAAWWESWPKSQRDHQTVCVSCHTMLPYALARPKLRGALNDGNTPEPEREMLRHLRTRVSLWSQVQPYYLDSKSGPGKSKESRSTESVLNALILASYDVGQEHLDSLT